MPQETTRQMAARVEHSELDSVQRRYGSAAARDLLRDAGGNVPASIPSGNEPDPVDVFIGTIERLVSAKTANGGNVSAKIHTRYKHLCFQIQEIATREVSLAETLITASLQHTKPLENDALMVAGMVTRISESVFSFGNACAVRSDKHHMNAFRNHFSGNMFVLGKLTSVTVADIKQCLQLLGATPPKIWEDLER